MNRAQRRSAPTAPGRTPEEQRLSGLILRLAPLVREVDERERALNADGHDVVIVAGWRASVEAVCGGADAAQPGNLLVRSKRRAALIAALRETGTDAHGRFDKPAGDDEVLVFVVAETSCIALRVPRAVLAQSGHCEEERHERVIVEGARGAKGGSA